MITARNCSTNPIRFFGILALVVATSLSGRAAGAADEGPMGQVGGFTKADFDRHVKQLQKKIPSRDFTVVITPPFVVIGDESPGAVRDRSEGTVKWAVEKLKNTYTRNKRAF